MKTTTTETGPYPPLTEWLERQGVPYELREHALAYTATEAARAEGVDVTTFAKVVGIRRSDGGNALAVLDASDQVDLKALRDALGVEWVALLSERDLVALAPACEAGTAPPIPELVGVPVYVDDAVRTDPKISFHAGSHRYSVRVDREAWERQAGVGFAKFAARRRSLRSLEERGLT